MNMLELRLMVAIFRFDVDSFSTHNFLKHFQR